MITRSDIIYSDKISQRTLAKLLATEKDQNLFAYGLKKCQFTNEEINIILAGIEKFRKSSRTQYLEIEYITEVIKTQNLSQRKLSKILEDHWSEEIMKAAIEKKAFSKSKSEEYSKRIHLKSCYSKYFECYDVPYEEKKEILMNYFDGTAENYLKEIQHFKLGEEDARKFKKDLGLELKLYCPLDFECVREKNELIEIISEYENDEFEKSLENVYNLEGTLTKDSILILKEKGFLRVEDFDLKREFTKFFMDFEDASELILWYENNIKKSRKTLFFHTHLKKYLINLLVICKVSEAETILTYLDSGEAYAKFFSKNNHSMMVDFKIVRNLLKKGDDPNIGKISSLLGKIVQYRYRERGYKTFMLLSSYTEIIYLKEYFLAVALKKMKDPSLKERVRRIEGMSQYEGGVEIYLKTNLEQYEFEDLYETLERMGDYEAWELFPCKLICPLSSFKTKDLIRIADKNDSLDDVLLPSLAEKFKDCPLSELRKLKVNCSLVVARAILETGKLKEGEAVDLALKFDSDKCWDSFGTGYGIEEILPF